MHRIAGFLLVAACLQLGCETRVSLGNPCASDDECAGALRCDYGRCRTECDDSADCGGGRFCLTISATEGVCTLPTDVCDEATRLHCEDGLACVDQACVAPCATSMNTCVPGTSCNPAANVCVPLLVATDAGVDAGMSVVDAPLDDAPALSDVACSETTFDGSTRTLCVGEHFSCAVAAGSVRCWGSNDGGQLGDGSTVHDATDHVCNEESGYDCAWTPVTVQTPTGALTGATSVACGQAHACAMTASGAVHCWGYVRGGYTYQAVEILSGGATAIFSGQRHVCARVGSGFQCWGENQSNLGTYEMPDFRIDRRLGVGVTETNVPLAAADFDGAVLLETGGYFTCTADATGVDCQGWSEATVCGNAPEFEYLDAGPFDGGVGGIARRARMPVVPNGNHITSLVPEDLHTGHLHACALVDGVVWCWGGNQYGNLGNDMDEIVCDTTSYYCRPTPRAIDTPLRFAALSHGNASLTCGIERVTGSVYCWGQNDDAQAGVAPDGMHNGVGLDAPVGTGGAPLTGVVEVAVGPTHTCARTMCGAVYCWGANGAAQLGRERIGGPEYLASQVIDL